MGKKCHENVMYSVVTIVNYIINIFRILKLLRVDLRSSDHKEKKNCNCVW